MNDEFLPSDYQDIPEEPSRYMKLSDGKNQFRVLSSAIVGYEWWVDKDGSRKPMRVRKEEEVPTELWKASDSREKPKHFWAFVVYNRSAEKVQILEITQKSVMKSIKSIMEDWGSPKEYDLIINRQKTGSEAFDVEYTALPIPASKATLDEGIVKYYEDLNINLDALYSGDDPFDSTKAEEKMQNAQKELSGKTIKEDMSDIPFGKD